MDGKLDGVLAKGEGETIFLKSLLLKKHLNS